jgi:serine/arginine repetitive matrix protein 1
VIKSWIEKRFRAILSFEDEVGINYLVSLLEDRTKPVDPRNIQLLMAGFLDHEAAPFMKELWNLLISAMKNEHGIVILYYNIAR